MTAILPIGTIPGLTSSLDAVDILLGTFSGAQTVTVGVLRHTNYDDGGATDTSVVGSIRNATGGGGDGIAFTIPDQTQSVVPSGSIEVAAGGSLYLRVSAGSNSMNLTGWLNLTGVSGITTALTNLARVKEFLDISGSGNDTLLTRLIAAVSGEVQTWLAHTIIQTTATGERYGHSGRNPWLPLIGYPIISITSLVEGDTTLVLDTDFELDEADQRGGIVNRISSGDLINWSWGRGHIQATYVHGYASVPDEVAHAATELVAYDFHRSKPGGGRLGIDGKALDAGGGSGYLTRGQVWAEQRHRLIPYQRRV